MFQSIWSKWYKCLHSSTSYNSQRWHFLWLSQILERIRTQDIDRNCKAAFKLSFEFIFYVRGLSSLKLRIINCYPFFNRHSDPGWSCLGGIWQSHQSCLFCFSLINWESQKNLMSNFSVESFLINSPVDSTLDLNQGLDIGISPAEIQDVLSESSTNPGSPGNER